MSLIEGSSVPTVYMITEPSDEEAHGGLTEREKAEVGFQHSADEREVEKAAPSVDV